MSKRLPRDYRDNGRFLRLEDSRSAATTQSTLEIEVAEAREAASIVRPLFLLMRARLRQILVRRIVAAVTRQADKHTGSAARARTKRRIRTDDVADDALQTPSRDDRRRARLPTPPTQNAAPQRQRPERPVQALHVNPTASPGPSFETTYADRRGHGRPDDAAFALLVDSYRGGTHRYNKS